ncbi:MAG: hypothetical protein JW726_18140 [Anaerolineales bacterium]|nr:hypothetical protein [Anaerolineales bacterium]
MFTKPRSLIILAVLLAMILLSACNLPQGQPSTTSDPNALYTQAAMTVQAQLTQNAVGTPVVMQPTQTAIINQPTQAVNTPVLPTNTGVPPTQAPPPATPVPPTATLVPVPCDRVAFVEDVTFPDNSEVAAGTTFVKTWRLKNTGSCTWTSSYAIVFDSGDAMGGPASAQLTTGTVAPGATVDVSVTLKAPDTTGTYRGEWELRNAAGATFGIGDLANKTFWVQIKVVKPTTPTPTATTTPDIEVVFDFISRGPDAQWRNATTTLPWGDPPDDAAGVAADLASGKLDDGKTYDRILATYPQRINDGMIMGTYPTYTVHDGDHFRATIGLRNTCDEGKVRYQFKYLEGGTEVLVNEWIETCDDKVTKIDIDLSFLSGKTVQFILVVKADGEPNDDLAYWAAPRIER